MYCPNCATEIPDDVTYCRGCGQDISLVVRSLKGHASVVLASKIDQYFDRPDERLLRDSVISFAIGAMCTSFFVWNAATGNAPWPLLVGVLLPLGVYGIADGIWKAAVYRHCLSLRTDLVPTESSRECFYCPRCGNQNDEIVKLCVACGTDLEYVHRALGSQRKSWISDLMDRTIAKYRKTRSNSGIAFAVALGLFVLISGVLEESTVFSLYGFIIAVLFIVPGIWDLIVERRRKNATDDGFEIQPKVRIGLADKRTPQLHPADSDIEIESPLTSAITRELIEESGGEATTKKLDGSG